MDPRESRTKEGISQANCLEHCLCGNYRPGEYWTQTSRRSEGTSYIIQEGEERINSHGKASCKAQSAWSFAPWPNPPAYLKKGTFFQGNRVADRLAAAAHSHRGCSTFTGPVSKEKKGHSSISNWKLSFFNSTLPGFFLTHPKEQPLFVYVWLRVEPLA